MTDTARWEDEGGAAAPVIPKSDFPNIAFCGRMGAGKTTAAEYLVEKFSYNKRGFADTLRSAANVIWGGKGNTRDKLQKFGVAVRDIDKDAWVNAALNSIETQVGMGYSPWVVDDMRFPNELARLKEAGFVTVRVVAEEAKRVVRLRSNGKLQDESQLEHVSETALDGRGTDYLVFNQGARDEFYRQLVEVIWQEAARR